MFVGKPLQEITSEARRQFKAQVAEYLQEHPTATRQEVADHFGLSLGYIDGVIHNHNIQRRRGRPTKKRGNCGDPIPSL